MVRRRRVRRRNQNPIPVLLRRRRVIRAIVTLIVAVIVLAFGLDKRGVIRGDGTDWSAFDHKQFPVTYIADGDTIDVVGPGGTQRIRLIGIDTPEMNNQQTNRPDHWAQQAKQYAQDELFGRQVTLRLEPTETRDKYDRLLAYVYLSESDHFNFRLVSEGHAYADRRHRHTFGQSFESAEADARKKKLGLWKNVTEAQMPEWRQRWLHSQREGSSPQR